MELGGIDYLAIFAVTLALALFLTPLALRFALRREILDVPTPIKAHDSPVPYLGGVAILVSFVAVILGAALLRPPEEGLVELSVILGLALLLALVGLADDLRNLSPWVRLTLEVGAGVVVWATPAGAQLFANDALDLAVTVLWIVGVTNAFNLLDNMDGLSAGVASIGAFFYFVIAADNGQFLVATLAVALAGCSMGFLRSNFHPARIYMGDAGALFLGFLLAVIGLKLQFDGPRSASFAVPILVVSVALFDTTLVAVNRLLHRRSPFSGGRDHTSHRLVFVGVPVPVAVGMIYVAAVSVGWMALLVSRVEDVTGMMLVAWILVVMVLGGVVLSRIPVYETSRRRHLMIREVLPHEADVADEPRSA